MRWLGIPILTALLAGGCGAQQGMLGTEGSTMLTTMDALTSPGQPATLQARLQQGDLLQGRPGYVIRFEPPAGPLLASETGDDGVATVTFTPSAAGDYPIHVSVSPVGLSEAPPELQKILVACRATDTPIVVVDLDKTLVASGFETVLLSTAGAARAMRGSQEVLKRLSRTHSIVYLTHRPDYFGLKSRRWLSENAYPAGPLLLSSVSGFLSGSGAFKTAAIARLRKQFSRVEIGIGDKLSDGRAYHANGMRAFVIVPISPDATPAQLEAVATELDAMPDAVQIVTGWDQIAEALGGSATFPPSHAAQRIRDAARNQRHQE